MSDISIIIVSYNTRDLTLKCINSLLNENSNLNKEIIVVDNASTDKTVESLLTLQGKIKKTKSKIELKVIKNDKNLGFSKAVNMGIKVKNGRYVFLLNTDCRVEKQTLKKLIDFSNNHKDAGVVAPQLLNTDGSIQASCFKLPTIKRALLQFWFGKEKILDKYAPTKEKFSEVESVVGAAFLITPLALKKVGLLNERYFMYFEDLEYCRRVRNAGLKVYYYPNAKVVHKHGATAKKFKFSKQREWLISSSKIYHGYFKHYIYNFIIWSGQKWKKLFY